ncbi:MAG: radical SAM protein [Candidatus Hydrogenedentes bacterium]|nr:radical SAM protein [Candidatus Hydrogenedentota bacterium]
MYDRFNRQIDYLRISVTDKCDLRCIYCMPEHGVPLIRHEDVLSFEEIEEFTRHAVQCGITKVRITGGEPLVRRGIVTLVEMLGTRLAEFAQPLAEAGIRRVNISLDAVDAETYSRMTRGGDIRNVVNGIMAAKAAGFWPIKINCVISQSPAEPDARAVAGFAERHGLEVRFIRRMNLERGTFSTVLGGNGGDCARCNRIRLTCDGWVRPCLFSDASFNVRQLGPREALRKAVEGKPESGRSSTAQFYSIGG